jgi:hypothetical protein
MIDTRIRRASDAQARRAIAGTPGGAAQGRVFVQVPAEDAGEVYLQAADGLLAHLRAAELLTWRQATAAATLARLWGIGGGSAVWRTTGGGGCREEDTVAAARREYRELLSVVRVAIRPAVDTLSMGEWIVAYNPLPVWREALDAVADRLKLEKEKG